MEIDKLPCHNGPEPQHCWHSTNVSLTVDPPMMVEVCCHCGTKRNVRFGIEVDLRKHGQFMPLWLR